MLFRSTPWCKACELVAASRQSGVIEVAFIVFLFYSNLLMGEFTASNGRGKSLAFALHDIFSLTNLAIAMISALIGYLVFEHLRKKL